MEDAMAFLGVKSYAVTDMPNHLMADMSRPRPIVNSKLQSSRRKEDVFGEDSYAMADIPNPRSMVMAKPPRPMVNSRRTEDVEEFLGEDPYEIPNPRAMVMADTSKPPRPMANSRRMEDVQEFLGDNSYDIPHPRVMVMADISKARPMVNSKLLRKYLGKRVTTVVKVLQVEGGNVVGELPDGAPITVHRAPQHVAAQSMFVEVVGVVESDRFLRAQICTGFGDNFGKARLN